MGALGAANFLWVRRRLALGDKTVWRWLRRFFAAEALVAVLVIAAVGMDDGYGAWQASGGAAQGGGAAGSVP